MPPELKTDELPSHIQHTIIIFLAKVFLEVMAAKQLYPTGGDLRAKGFDDLPYLVKRGWIIAPAGRFEISYRPGQDVLKEMNRLNAERSAA